MSAPKLEIYLQSLQRFGIRPGLERIAALLSRVGNPQREYLVALVGGTNGKGSTCEFLARLLLENGKKVGLYTSPHLYEWNERIRVLEDGISAAQPPASSLQPLFAGQISDAALDALFEDALPHLQAVAASELGQPTEFEVLTFLGLWYFARQKVDIAVVEVGLGGRWDATNICDPMVSVITHVALDHCDRLGNTLEEIARDKIEITRAGRTLVTAETKPEVLQVFRERAQTKNFKLQIADCPPTENFQQINLCLARATLGVLSEVLQEPLLHPSSFILHPSVVPGRFETIRENPRIILDGANNPDGAQHLAIQLGSTPKAPNAKLILVLGILKDKDYAAMIEILAPLADVVIATQSPSPRAADAEILAQKARAFCEYVEVSTPVMAALERALELANENDTICVTGSFYTIAEIERGYNCTE
jgi:dihydrofolate synthase/folylpolyglutamate synthase